LHQFFEHWKVAVALLHQLIDKMLDSDNDFLVFIIPKISVAVLQNIVFKVIDSIKLLEMVHQISRNKGLLASGVLCFQVPHEIVLKPVQRLEYLFVVIKVMGSTDDFENVEIEREDFFRNDDLGLFSTNFVMVHVTEGLATDFHVNLRDSFLNGSDESFVVLIALLVHIFEIFIESRQS
jgi:hypothetical protein